VEFRDKQTFTVDMRVRANNDAAPSSGKSMAFTAGANMGRGLQLNNSGTVVWSAPSQWVAAARLYHLGGDCA